MANKTMKTLTIGGNTYEIVDEAARTNIENLTADDVSALSIDMTDSETGVTPFTNADSLGGVAAGDYALKADIVQKTGDIMTGTLEVPSLSINGVEIRELLFPVGSIYTTSTNVNPADRLGGEWSLVSKMLATNYYNQSSGVITINNDKVSALGTTGIRVAGEVLEMYVTLTTAVELTDDLTELFTLDLNSIGLTSFGNKRVTANSDGGNGIVMIAITSDGVVSSGDIVTKTSDATIAANNIIIINHTFTINQSYMIDSFCDKFFWKRTA